jgi:precorrin-6B methylase 2
MSANTIPPEPDLLERLFIFLRRPTDEKLKSLGYHFAECTDFVYEKVYGLDIRGLIPLEDLETDHVASRPHATAYGPCSSRHVRVIIEKARSIQPDLQRFVDIGSGKGKACIFAARSRRFREIVGIEFSQPLVNIAIANAAKSGFPQIRFLHQDASDFALPDGNNLVAIFNPFNSVMLARFIGNNLEHFRQNRSLVAYVYDHHRGVLLDLGFKTVFRDPYSQMSLHEFAAGSH